MQRQPLTHDRLDERSLAFDEIIAGRLRSAPSLIQVAKSILSRRLSTCGPRVRPALLEWEEILNGDFQLVLEVLTARDQRSTRLRQSSPFCGEQFITREERNGVIRKFRDVKAPA